MPFEAIATDIPGLTLIRPHMYQDDRGLYLKHYEKQAFHDMGITCSFNDSSDLYTKKGALRGLHYQQEESQAKLVRVISGTVFDVALDIRSGSPTFGRYHTQLLRGGEHMTLFIPEGFAHGFIALEDSVFSYQTSGRYLPKAAGGIRWDDPQLNIPWPLADYGITDIIATEKDKHWPTLEAYAQGLAPQGGSR